MLSSMTGIGVVYDIFKDSALTLEIKSVNHRYLDISFRMPKFLSILEKDFRNLIKSRINRGKVNISIKFENAGKLFSNVNIDIELAKHYHNALKKLSKTLNVPGEVELKDFLDMKGVLELTETEPNENLKKFLTNSMENALDKLIAMKNEEGKHLEVDVLKRVDLLKINIAEIEDLKDSVVETYKSKLKNKIAEIFGGNRELLDEQRLEFEVTLFSDKSDITEEIVRFSSHIEKFLRTIKEKPPVGKKLDFILQEMNREINTIGSKNNLNNISNIVIDTKTGIEKIREQIQNVE